MTTPPIASDTLQTSYHTLPPELLSSRRKAIIRPSKLNEYMTPLPWMPGFGFSLTGYGPVDSQKRRQKWICGKKILPRQQRCEAGFSMNRSDGKNFKYVTQENLGKNPKQSRSYGNEFNRVQSPFSSGQKIKNVTMHSPSKPTSPSIMDDGVTSNRQELYTRTHEDRCTRRCHGIRTGLCGHFDQRLLPANQNNRTGNGHHRDGFAALV